MAPSGTADGLHHHVDPLGQSGGRLERIMCAELAGALALLLGAGGNPNPDPGAAGQRGQRGRHAARRALHEHGHPRHHPRAREQHPVGGQPRGGQAGHLLEGELRGLGDQVAAGDGDPGRERSLMLLGEQRSPRVERLIPAPGVVRDHRVDHDLVPLLIEAGGITAQDHR